MNLVKGFQQIRSLNSLSAAITKPHRLTYTRTHPTALVLPNGASFTIRYQEPRQIIKLPVNVWTLSEAERKARIEKRKPKKKVKIVEETEDDDYDSNEYLKYLKKK